MESCSNCSTPLQGRFCHQCGQQMVAGLPSLKLLITTFWDDFIAFDNKLWRTLKATFVPAKLTNEWIAGKQASYVSPMRMFAFLLFLFALNMTFFSNTGNSEVLDNIVEGIVKAGEGEAESPEQVQQAVHQVAGVLAMVGIPVMAFWMFLFNKRALFYVNTVFSLHLCNVLLMTFLIARLITRPIKWSVSEQTFDAILPPIMFAVLGLLVLYFVISAKRVYGIGYFGAVFKSLAFMVCFFSSVVVISNVLFMAFR